MQVQVNTSLLLDGLPTYIAYLHCLPTLVFGCGWLPFIDTPHQIAEHLYEEHRHMCFKNGGERHANPPEGNDTKQLNSLSCRGFQAEGVIFKRF